MGKLLSPAVTAQSCLCLQEVFSSCLWTVIHLSEILPFHSHLPPLMSINCYTLRGSELASEQVPGSSGRSILPRSTWHIPASAQGRLSPGPEGMPEDEFSATASGLAFCRSWEPSCSPGQLFEASVATVTQSTKAVSAPGDNIGLCRDSASSDHRQAGGKFVQQNPERKTQVRAHRVGLQQSVKKQRFS